MGAANDKASATQASTPTRCPQHELYPELSRLAGGRPLKGQRFEIALSGTRTRRHGWSRVRLTLGVCDQQAIELFGWGRCWMLAGAIHDLTGWPYAAVEETLPQGGNRLTHVGVLTPAGAFLDIFGQRSVAEVVRSFRPAHVRVREAGVAEITSFAPPDGWRSPAHTADPVIIEITLYFARHLIGRVLPAGAGQIHACPPEGDTPDPGECCLSDFDLGLDPFPPRQPRVEGLERDHLQGLLRHLTGEWPSMSEDVLLIPVRRRELWGLQSAIISPGSVDAAGPLRRVMHYLVIEDWLARGTTWASSGRVDERVLATAERLVAEHQNAVTRAQTEWQRQRQIVAEITQLEQAVTSDTVQRGFNSVDLEDKDQGRLAELRSRRLQGRERRRYEGLLDSLTREQPGMSEEVLLVPAHAREMKGLVWALTYPASPDDAGLLARFMCDLVHDWLARGEHLAGLALARIDTTPLHVIADYQNAIEEARRFLALAG
ncbi:hypothetical protein ACQEVF_57360 [Nonomuraea polychroma]|uniref:hypothetical protein n=1 Tax=Nonomuraea polychroma TaxID=46176 RepID=UPI003D8C87B3